MAEADNHILIDEQNPAQMQALEIVRDTNASFFLTGRAGTGKTTFLHYIKEDVNKQFIVVAPTGIAGYHSFDVRNAIDADYQGYTISNKRREMAGSQTSGYNYHR